MPATLKKPIDQKSPKARAVREIQDWIEDGRLRPGGVLPAERALAEEIGVGRLAVRRAVQLLEGQGVIRHEGGRTRTIAYPPESAAAGAGGNRASGGIMARTIVVLVPSLPVPDPAAKEGPSASGWTDHVVHGVMREAGDQGLQCLAVNPRHLEAGDPDRFAGDPPAGLVIPEIESYAVPPESVKRVRELGDRLATAGVPTVSYGGDRDRPRGDRVVSDHVEGSYLLTKRLLDWGRRRVLPVMLKPLETYWIADRLRGYDQACREVGVKSLEPVAMVHLPKEGPEDASLLEVQSRLLFSYLVRHLAGHDAIDGLLLPSDEYVVPAAEACRLAGRDPNQDLSIVGYDNFWPRTWQHRLAPHAPLATVDKNNFVAGRECVRLLLDRRAGRLKGDPVAKVVPPRLIDVQASGSKTVDEP